MAIHFFKDLVDTKVHLTGKAKLWNFLYQLSAILLAHFHCYLKIGINKTGLQPVSRPVEQVHYFEGWGVVQSKLCTKSLAAKTLQTDKQTGLAVVPDALFY